MRIILASVFVTAITACPVVVSSADFTAHEWGTFTTIADSRGDLLPWWTPKLEGPAELPEFVAPVINFTKNSQPYLVRMETPVIYFYPAIPMEVTVGVRYPGGRLTEVFPALAPDLDATSASQGERVYQWKLDLLPPNAANERLIPPVGTRGAHYRHARDVPSAWVVRGARLADQDFVKVQPSEKFVFYRGAGGGQMPLRAHLGENGDIHIKPQTSLRAPAYLIKIKEGVIHWDTSIIASTAATDGSFKGQTFAPPARGGRNARQDLAAALTRSLAEAGLSEAEAAAMVATWDDAWLGEEGTRVLYLLPHAWVDATLPLEITPKPGALKRVFVARAEMLGRGQEQALAALLNSPASEDAKRVQLRALGLGRFASAALERAVQIRSEEMRAEFGRLTARTGNETGLEFPQQSR